MNTIPQCNPRAEYLKHHREIDQAIRHVLDSGRYILGSEVEAFEREFAQYIGVAHAVGVASGTDAVSLALKACGVEPGDLVFTVSHTAVATVAAVESIEAVPVLVDIDPDAYTMDPHCLEVALESAFAGRPKAVVAVHLYGHPADMSAICEVARRYNIVVVEDCAQSHGSRWMGKPTGGWGHAAAFSFYPTKNLGALGDGGMVVTGDAAVAANVRLLRQYGWERRYVSRIRGTNSRLDELQAAILRIKLRYLEEDNRRRIELAARYSEGLKGTDVVLPLCRKGATHVYHQYVIRSLRRDRLASHLAECGIGTSIHYPQAVHQQPAYAGRVVTAGALPWSERAAAEALSLPMYPGLSKSEVGMVCACLRKAFTT